MILINPGGPAASGVNEARDNASTIQSLIGTNWDVIGFDARGIWLSEPSASCQSTNTTSGHRYTLRSKYPVPRVTDEFYNSYIKFGKELGRRCKTSIGGNKNTSLHMTTAITARDILSVVDAFAETNDGCRATKRRSLLNYYGIQLRHISWANFRIHVPREGGQYNSQRRCKSGKLPHKLYVSKRQLSRWYHRCLLHLLSRRRTERLFIPYRIHPKGNL